jgi:hypothetical protein
MSQLRVSIPRSSNHPYTMLLVTTPNETVRMSFDDSHKTTEIELPEGVTEDQVGIIAEFWDARNQRDAGMEPVVVKEAKPKTEGDGDKKAKDEGKKGRKGKDDKESVKPEGDTTPEDKPAEGDKTAEGNKPAEKVVNP